MNFATNILNNVFSGRAWDSLKIHVVTGVGYRGSVEVYYDLNLNEVMCYVPNDVARQENVTGKVIYGDASHVRDYLERRSSEKFPSIEDWPQLRDATGRKECPVLFVVDATRGEVYSLVTSLQVLDFEVIVARPVAGWTLAQGMHVISSDQTVVVVPDSYALLCAERSDAALASMARALSEEFYHWCDSMYVAQFLPDSEAQLSSHEYERRSKHQLKELLCEDSFFTEIFEFLPIGQGFTFLVEALNEFRQINSGQTDPDLFQQNLAELRLLRLPVHVSNLRRFVLAHGLEICAIFSFECKEKRNQVKKIIEEIFRDENDNRLYREHRDLRFIEPLIRSLKSVSTPTLLNVYEIIRSTRSVFRESAQRFVSETQCLYPLELITETLANKADELLTPLRHYYGV